MRSLSILTGIFTGILLACLPELGAAMTVGEAINRVGGTAGLTASYGGNEVGGIFGTAASNIILIINAVAILIVAITGTIMALSESDEQSAILRRVFISCICGIFFVNVADIVRDAIVDPGATFVANSGSAGTIATEIEGVILWTLPALASIAVLMIIISGIRAVVSYKSDEGPTQLRRTVISCMVGLFIISVRGVLTGDIIVTNSYFGGGTGGSGPSGIIAEIIFGLNRILAYVALFAVFMIVLAGIFMIANVGNDDQYSKARGLIIRVLVGIIVMVASLGLVNVIFLGASA